MLFHVFTHRPSICDKIKVATRHIDSSLIISFNVVYNVIKFYFFKKILLLFSVHMVYLVLNAIIFKNIFSYQWLSLELCFLWTSFFHAPLSGWKYQKLSKNGFILKKFWPFSIKFWILWVTKCTVNKNRQQWIHLIRSI